MTMTIKLNMPLNIAMWNIMFHGFKSFLSWLGHKLFQYSIVLSKLIVALTADMAGISAFDNNNY